MLRQKDQRRALRERLEMVMAASMNQREGSWENMRLVGHTTIDGMGDGMGVTVKDGFAFFAHQGHIGTSIVDVRDPRNPHVVNRIPAPANTHSHKVQIHGDLMLINRERLPDLSGGTWQRPWTAGLSIFDVSDPSRPAEIGFWPCGGRGVHRTSFWSEPYAYITAGSSEFAEQFLVVLDLSDPTRPIEVGRWWFPGMRNDELAIRNWGPERTVRLHHAIPVGDRLYSGWFDLGVIIHDISDPKSPELVAHLDPNQVDGESHHTHTAQPLVGRDALVVTDEVPPRDHCNIHEPGGKKYFARIVDISDEASPTVLSRFPQPPEDLCYCVRSGRLGPHNLHEMRPDSFHSGSIVFMTWFNGGVRVYDVSELENPVEIAHFIPPASRGRSSSQINDIYVHNDGLVYATERHGAGLYILEHDQ